MKESNIQNRIHEAAAQVPGLRLFRNNVAQGWVGKQVSTTGKIVLLKDRTTGAVRTLREKSVLLREPRILHAGLQKGSADLIGWFPVTIGPEHVGQTLAVFVSAEVKTATGRIRKDQRNWMERVNAAGGLGLLVRSGEELIKKVKMGEI